MAKVMNRQMDDKTTHEFLTNNGFVVTANIDENHCNYLYETFYVTIPKDTLITTHRELYRFLFDSGYGYGLEQGKYDAVRSLLKQFTDVICGRK